MRRISAPELIARYPYGWARLKRVTVTVGCVVVEGTFLLESGEVPVTLHATGARELVLNPIACLVRDVRWEFPERHPLLFAYAPTCTIVCCDRRIADHALPLARGIAEIDPHWGRTWGLPRPEADGTLTLGGLAEPVADWASTYMDEHRISYHRKSASKEEGREIVVPRIVLLDDEDAYIIADDLAVDGPDDLADAWQRDLMADAPPR